MKPNIPRFDMVKALQNLLQRDDWVYPLIDFYLNLEAFYGLHGTPGFIEFIVKEAPDELDSWMKSCSYTIIPKEDLKRLVNQVVSKKLFENMDILQKDFPFKYLVINQSCLAVDHKNYPVAIYQHRSNHQKSSIGYLKALPDQHKQQIKSSMKELFVIPKEFLTQQH